VGDAEAGIPVQDFNEGNYFLTQFTAEPNVTGSLENALRLSEELLRHLLVKLDS
jgi:small subunit ribosomal protein S6